MNFQPKPPRGDATHAGGVVYRERGNQVEYLLVQATGTQQEWVLPKGHIEAGESTRDAAVREVHEEARVRAEIVDELDTVEFELRGNSVRIQYYLMKALREDRRRGEGVVDRDEKRERAWLPLEQAQEQLAHEANRKLLDLAELKRRGS